MKSFFALAFVVVLASCNGSDNKPDKPDQDSSLIPIPVPVIAYNIVADHPHDPGAYTQGLEFHNGTMYESTGDYAKSTLRITDYKTGKVEKNHPMGSNEIFGEGMTIFKDKIYQLTWQSNVVYVYDIKDITKPIKTFVWPYEGWGITHNETDLIISTGVNPNLYFVDPDNFKIKNILPVNDSKGPVFALNELEWIDGFVFANVYETDSIYKIDPQSGKVVGVMNLAGVIQKAAPEFHPIPQDEVLNGIAYDTATKTMFITGKRWPRMFEVKLN